MNRPMHTADSKAVDSRAKSIARSSESFQHDVQTEPAKSVPMKGQSLEARLLRRLLIKLGDLPLVVHQSSWWRSMSPIVIDAIQEQRHTLVHWRLKVGRSVNLNVQVLAPKIGGIEVVTQQSYDRFAAAVDRIPPSHDHAPLFEPIPVRTPDQAFPIAPI